jgi:hypothetical protein
VLELTPSKKGAITEAAIALAAIRLDLLVLRPMTEGGRYDLALDTGEQILRLQCKSAWRQRDVLITPCNTNRHTPRGYIRTTYSAAEVDAVAAYSPDTDRCYLIPIRDVAGMSAVSLRLAPTRNNQMLKIRWAKDYEFEASLQRHWGFGPELKLAEAT